MLSRHSASTVGWPCIGVCSLEHTLRHGRICAYRILVYFDDVYGRGVAERRRNAASEATHKLQACRVRGSDGDYAGINGAGRVLGGTETALRRACWHELNVDCWRVEWIDMDLDLDGRRRGSMSEIKMSRGWLTKDAFLMIVGVWFLFVFVFLLALNRGRI
jgi:hypothetical protein